MTYPECRKTAGGAENANVVWERLEEQRNWCVKRRFTNQMGSKILKNLKQRRGIIKPDLGNAIMQGGWEVSLLTKKLQVTELQELMGILKRQMV